MKKITKKTFTIKHDEFNGTWNTHNNMRLCHSVLQYFGLEKEKTYTMELYFERPKTPANYTELELYVVNPVSGFWYWRGDISGCRMNDGIFLGGNIDNFLASVFPDLKPHKVWVRFVEKTS